MKTAEQEVARNETGSSWSGTFHLPHEERRKNTRSSFGVICVYLCYDFFSTRLRYSRDTQRFAACFILRAFSKLQVSIAPWGKHTTRGCRRHRMSFPDRHVTNQRIQTNYILLHPRPGASLLRCAFVLLVSVKGELTSKALCQFKVRHLSNWHFSQTRLQDCFVVLEKKPDPEQQHDFLKLPDIFSTLQKPTALQLSTQLLILCYPRPKKKMCLIWVCFFKPAKLRSKASLFWSCEHLMTTQRVAAVCFWIIRLLNC